MPLHAVVFDYGMVLSGPAVETARKRLLEITGLQPESFDRYYWKYRLDYDRGTLNGRTYWQAIARDAGLSPTPEQIEALVEEDVRLWASVNPTMLDWAARVQEAGFKTAILSNMGEDLLAHMRENFRWLDHFHHLTWSCELNFVKPEAEIYRHTLERLGVAANDALFLDDKAENVAGARAVGMHALLFRDAKTLQSDLNNDSLFATLPSVIR